LLHHDSRSRKSNRVSATRLEGLDTDDNEKKAEGEKGQEGADSEQGLVGLGGWCGDTSWVRGCCGGPVKCINRPV